MFFDNLDQLPELAKRCECAIFVLPKNTPVSIKHALVLEPSTETKTKIISIDQVREFINLSQSRETSDRFFIINPADAMNEPAQNAFLKTLEEPNNFCHFVLITTDPTKLLPTILSRAQVFFYAAGNPLDIAPTASEKVMAYAKRLIAANAQDLPDIAAEITKSKTDTRETALLIASTAIELLYKSYLKTNNPKFLKKLPGFIKLHDSLSQNGHVKLHLVADLL